jgi:hypothetical protein
MPDIERFEDVQTFFGEQVTEAMRDLRVEAATDTQDYLIDLLSDFSISNRIPILCESLAALLQKAMDAKGPDRLSRMQDLGDVALFICGFFPDSFDRRGLSRTYVVGMGGRAYLVLGQAARAQGRRGEVFVELGDRFHDMARVLDEVRERTAMCTTGQIVKLYERWYRSGSPSLAARLRRRGVHPSRRPARGNN